MAWLPKLRVDPLVSMRWSTVAQGFRIHTRISVPTLFMPTPTKRTITQTSRTLKRQDLSVARVGVGDA